MIWLIWLSFSGFVLAGVYWFKGMKGLLRGGSGMRSELMISSIPWMGSQWGGLLRGGSGMRSELMISSIPWMGSQWGGSRFSRQQSGLPRGFFVKAGYSVARTSSDASTINGANGACSRRHVSENKVLDAYEDEYGGMVIDPERLPRSPLVFESMIRASLSRWKLEGKTGIWLKLPSDHSELVPVAVKEGFKYHHAEQNYVMLTYWIPEGPCLLPANASHQVGIGGFVINEQNEVLVVQEKHCASALEGVWKLPTGFILESEEIPSGAVREVKEETGINTEFMEIIAFRHAHHVAFEKSDLFFICMLRPLSTHIEIDNLEIRAAKWMPLADFVDQPSIQDDNMFMKIINICIARLGKRYCGLAAHPVISKFDGRSSCLYYNVTDPRDFNCPGG